ncbi:MAG: DUF2804 family protein [Desulfobacterales bacterium]
MKPSGIGPPAPGPFGRTQLWPDLACGVNETSYTENAFWIDGRMTKVDTVAFDFNPEKFL